VNWAQQGVLAVNGARQWLTGFRAAWDRESERARVAKAEVTAVRERFRGEEAFAVLQSFSSEVCDAAEALFAENDGAPVYLLRDGEPVAVLVTPEWHDRAVLEVER